MAEGIGKRLPTVSYLVGTADAEARRSSGTRWSSLAGDDVELQRIAVDPAYRRRGLASALLAEVETVAVAAGGTRLLLEVRDDNDDGDRVLREPWLRRAGPPPRATTGTVPPRWSWGRKLDTATAPRL